MFVTYLELRLLLEKLDELLQCPIHLLQLIEDADEHVSI